MADSVDDRYEPLTPAEATLLADIRGAESLDALGRVIDESLPHDAYLTAKELWTPLRERELGPPEPPAGLPAVTVTVRGTAFHVHGITHADTDAERSFLREHLADYLDDGASVYCEQGIRSMYFEDLPAVCEMDDYRWAIAECRKLDADSNVADLVDSPFTGLDEELSAVTDRLRDTAFSLIHTGRDVYGDRFADALGDVASDFLRSHEALATGEAFTSFVRTRAAAENPAALVDLARYYETAFLPQPLEREWLRRHDPELELLTHARNARMADYVLDAAGDAGRVHLVVGAAHRPGVRYYLERHRDGERSLDGFVPV